jgi:hypothetical protein
MPTTWGDVKGELSSRLAADGESVYGTSSASFGDALCVAARPLFYSLVREARLLCLDRQALSLSGVPVGTKILDTYQYTVFPANVAHGVVRASRLWSGNKELVRPGWRGGFDYPGSTLTAGSPSLFREPSPGIIEFDLPLDAATVSSGLVFSGYVGHPLFASDSSVVAFPWLVYSGPALMYMASEIMMLSVSEDVGQQRKRSYRAAADAAMLELKAIATKGRRGY